MTTPDETPPIEEPVNEVKESVKETVPEPDKAVVPDTKPDPETKPDEVPAWGQELMAQVNALTEQVAAPVADVIDPDESPTPQPWHKRSFWGMTK